MSLRSLFDRTAVVTRAAVGAPDAEGNWTSPSQSTVVYPCRLDQQETRVTVEGADRLITRWVLFLPREAVIGGRDLVTIGGRRFEVEGEPDTLHGRSGPHHIEALLRTVDL